MDIREEASKQIAILKKEMAKHNCPAKKEIGDRVKVWDGSYNEDADTGEDRHGIDPLFEDNEAIVIGVNQQVFRYTDYFKTIKYKTPIQLDLLLAFPTGEKVYCASNCVKLVKL